MLIDQENSLILDIAEDEKIDVVADRIPKQFKSTFQKQAK